MDEFEYKGFKYRIVSVVDATVELIYAGELTGKIVVPEEVEYQNQKCKVVAIRGERKTEYYDYQPDDKRRKVERRSREVTCPVFVGQSLQSFQDKLEVVLPKSLKKIGDYAFYNCYNLVSVNIPDSVTSIGKDAFYYCKALTSITLPNSVTSIGEYAFYGCDSLTSVTLNSNAIVNKEYTSSNNIGHIFGSQVTKYIFGDDVQNIGKRAFSNCKSLNSLSISNSVTNIGYEAFRGCFGLTSIIIPNSVTNIEGWAFSDCTGLTSLVIPNSVKSIGRYAFFGCISLASIDVNINNTNYSSVDGVLFSKDKTLLIQYPEGKKGTYIIPESVKSIGHSAFFNCYGLTSVHIPNSVPSIGYEVFCNCKNLTSVNIPNSVTSIGSWAFSRCSSLTSVTIPNSVTSIGEHAFDQCRVLTSVTIPISVTNIGNYTFSNCSKLSSVIIENKEGKVTIGDDTFPSSAKITYVGKPKEQPAKPAEKEIAQAKPEAPKATNQANPGVVIDLEKLMAAALIDGVVTDKERAILIKKVKEAGGDVDEFEMLLDARIYEAQQKQAQ